ncbi:MAG: glycosyltransferase [Candidatus Paceibacterota bacterium]
MQTKNKQYETIILIPTFNEWDVLEACLQSLQKQTYNNFKIIVINDGSEDQIEKKINNNFNNVDTFTLDKNQGFAKAVNKGIKYTLSQYSPHYIALLNNDTIVEKEWLQSLTKKIKKEKNTAAVTSNMFFYSNRNTINSQGGTIDWNGDGYDINIFKDKDSGYQDSQQVFGACFGACLMDIKAIKDIELLDERFYAYYEDVDWSWRANLYGYKIFFEKDAFVYHHKSKSWKQGNRKLTYLTKRNCLTSALKNYQLKNLLPQISKIFIGYLLFTLDYLFFQYNLPKKISLWQRIKYITVPLQAIYWNLINLPKTLYLRNKIQNKRVVKDKKIFELLEQDETPLHNFLSSIKNKLSFNYLYSKIISIFHTPKNTFGVNILGYIDAQSGVGEAARSLIRAVKEANIPYALNNETTSPSERDDTKYNKEFKNYNPYPINIIVINGDTFKNVLRNRSNLYTKDKYNIAYWAWELEDIPKKWIPLINIVDEIWVPSSFVKNAFEKHTKKPITIIPHSINIKRSFFNRKYFSISNDKFVFLYIFDFYSHFERKNPLALVNAFKKSFENNESVKLIIKCSNSQSDQENFKKIKNETEQNKNIEIIDKYLTRKEILSLINICNAYVSPHRSEGFGLTIAEAMSLGKPVIATNYSGNTDFMNEDNSFPVDYKLIELKKDYGPYKKGNAWADININKLSKYMKYLYENPKQIKNVSENAIKTINSLLSPKAISKKISERLNIIYKK